MLSGLRSALRTESLQFRLCNVRCQQRSPLSGSCTHKTCIPAAWPGGTRLTPGEKHWFLGRPTSPWPGHPEARDLNAGAASQPPCPSGVQGRKRLLLSLQGSGSAGPGQVHSRDEWQAGSVPREVGESPPEWALVSWRPEDQDRVLGESLSRTVG